jgi:hypothetical protein
MCGRTSASREAVLNVLHALCLVGIWKPVLAHVEVVAEPYGTAGHENLGDGEGRHNVVVRSEWKRIKVRAIVRVNWCGGDLLGTRLECGERVEDTSIESELSHL